MASGKIASLSQKHINLCKKNGWIFLEVEEESYDEYDDCVVGDDDDDIDEEKKKKGPLLFDVVICRIAPHHFNSIPKFCISAANG